MKINTNKPLPPPPFNNIFEIIVSRIIRKLDSNIIKPSALKYNTSTTDLFTINTADLSPQLLKNMEENKIWQDIHGYVSPETYTARVILYSHAKRNINPFFSKNEFCIKTLIMELENKFSSRKTKEELINHFCKFKQTYWAFTKFARIWKIKRIPTRIQTDLYMNELDPNLPSTFQLVHPNGIYLFSLQNLARIIVDAITHQSGMFVEPLPIKNPYTNGILSKCDLINIYLSLKNNNIRIHEMLEKFFRCEFNIFEFRRKHETELRDLAIFQYAKNASPEELAQDIDDMFRLHKMTTKIKISPGFPQKKLVETMRPFLQVYLLERFSFSSMTRKFSAKQLDRMLNQFAEKNPKYGNRMDVRNTSLVFGSNPFYLRNECAAPSSDNPQSCVGNAIIANPFSSTPKNIKQEKKYVTEISQHINYCKSNYMKTHIYNEDTFDRYIENGDSLKTYVYPYAISEQQIYIDTDPYPQLNESDSSQYLDPDPEISAETLHMYFLRNNPYQPSSIVSQINHTASSYSEDSSHTNAREILNRIRNRIRISPSDRIQNIGETPTGNMDAIENIQNTVYSDNIHVINNNQNTYSNRMEDSEEEEEVIQNTNNNSDSESDTDWANEIMEDGEDSI
jgi:hypothetical protein